MLEEGIGDHRHEGMSMEQMQGSSFEVIKPKLFLELLMGLFADSPGAKRAAIGWTLFRSPGPIRPAT
jgi:hypothetical protein